MKPPTITIQIGNRGDKLTGPQWRAYVADIAGILAECATVFFHSGIGVVGAEPAVAAEHAWQNAVWVVEMKAQGEEARADLTDEVLFQLTAVRKLFQQDRLAVTRGHTLFY